ncbi:MAG TPA: M1 family metallopeptidase [Pyrinomonadaceae bacterium]|jgi:aminopeptidase N|nr:M1 family metallopeptidase [Pyrinomonadaceae bacterium]
MNKQPPSISHSLSLIALVLLLLLSSFTRALAERHERAVERWRPLHYDVSLTFNDQLSEITTARTVINILILKDEVKTIDLDFGEMPVDAINVGSTPAHYERRPNALVITLPSAARKNDRLNITVAYHGRPKDGLVLTADKDGKPSATGDNWPDRVHHWIPCLDHPSAKATVSFQIVAPASDLVVANGRFVGVNHTSKATALMRWSYSEAVPIPPYCMVISISQGALVEPKIKDLSPLSYYVPQSDSKYASQGFAPAAPVLNFFSRTIAPYPYEKLALIVGATRFGGMENSSAIVFPSNLFEPRKEPQATSRRFNIRQGLEEVIAHEIAHQWFGDSVTEKTWSDLWLSEGFATYFAGLFLEHEEGEAVFRDYMKHAAERYFVYEHERRAPVFDADTEDLFKLLNPNNYEKGAWVLHMLRGRVGDKAFFDGIRAYYLAHRNSTATSEDLRAALEKASGVDLREFFARWIYGAGHPQYELFWTWNPTRTNGGTLAMNLKQVQPDGPFLNPLPVDIVMPGRAQRAVLRPASKETTLSLHLAQRPTELRADPDATVLKEISVKAQN